MVLTAAATFLVSPVQSAACSSVAPPENVSTSDDVQSLRDALNCTGQRSLSVTWRGAIQIDERIVVSTGKSLTVSGANGDDQDEIDAGHNDGIFLVSDQSMLTLKYLTLRDGNASSSGGAIAITNASTVVVEDCNFTGNSAEGSGDIFYICTILLRFVDPRSHIVIFQFSTQRDATMVCFVALALLRRVSRMTNSLPHTNNCAFSAINVQPDEHLHGLTTT